MDRKQRIDQINALFQVTCEILHRCQFKMMVKKIEFSDDGIEFEYRSAGKKEAGEGWLTDDILEACHKLLCFRVERSNVSMLIKLQGLASNFVNDCAELGRNLDELHNSLCQAQVAAGLYENLMLSETLPCYWPSRDLLRLSRPYVALPCKVDAVENIQLEGTWKKPSECVCLGLVQDGWMRSSWILLVQVIYASWVDVITGELDDDGYEAYKVYAAQDRSMILSTNIGVAVLQLYAGDGIAATYICQIDPHMELIKAWTHFGLVTDLANDAFHQLVQSQPISSVHVGEGELYDLVQTLLETG